MLDRVTRNLSPLTLRVNQTAGTRDAVKSHLALMMRYDKNHQHDSNCEKKRQVPREHSECRTVLDLSPCPRSSGSVQSTIKTPFFREKSFITGDIKSESGVSGRRICVKFVLSFRICWEFVNKTWANRRDRMSDQTRILFWNASHYRERFVIDN